MTTCMEKSTPPHRVLSTMRRRGCAERARESDSLAQGSRGAKVKGVRRKDARSAAVGKRPSKRSGFPAQMPQRPGPCYMLLLARVRRSPMLVRFHCAAYLILLRTQSIIRPRSFDDIDRFACYDEAMGHKRGGEDTHRRLKDTG